MSETPGVGDERKRGAWDDSSSPIGSVHQPQLPRGIVWLCFSRFEVRERSLARTLLAARCCPRRDVPRRYRNIHRHGRIDIVTRVQSNSIYAGCLPLISTKEHLCTFRMRCFTNDTCISETVLTGKTLEQAEKFKFFCDFFNKLYTGSF